MINTESILQRPISFLKGVGPTKGELLKQELGIHTNGDLLYHFPFRYIDKTKFYTIRDLNEESGEVQLKGILRRLEMIGEGAKRRLVGTFRDETGVLELVWFKGAQYLQKQLSIGGEYIVYGRINMFNHQFNIPHPEMDLVTPENTTLAETFAPVYPSTEKLNNKGADVKNRRKLLKTLLAQLTEADLPENLPTYVVQKLRLGTRFQALQWIHFPNDEQQLRVAQNRLKFEELFFLQLRLLQLKRQRKDSVKGYVFEKVGDYFNEFFTTKLPFSLTNAQKRVIKEIRRDLALGIQMNRLLQGDVGSGKTIVALMIMLIAIDNTFQSCLMAPTEILAQQHYLSIKEYVKDMGIEVAFLAGSIKGKKREEILKRLKSGEIHILIGTHALLEDPVEYHHLGLAVTDEQHRFGVEQRAKLWRKSLPCPPHVLVMTATPIPRTLAMTLYGDLDVSVIDELPPGRKEIKTLHKTDNYRPQVIGFMKEEIAKGRQVYVVYPLIEESEKMDLQNLEQGHEALSIDFPAPQYQISIVHGRMKAIDKELEMRRFVEGESQLMVATTVIEVGVNVPNASVMVIENTERFGLSQLHQLRGRVGRGAAQSYCILMSSFKLSKESKERIQTMCRTNNGFEIAEADLRLRGPGNIEGTQQSGIIQLRLADLSKDEAILKTAREIAQQIIEADTALMAPEHRCLKIHLEELYQKNKGWSRIS
ncbi:MAG: ATP-dependent DNA helicase RecG [Saprospiraceae bacterium]|nr:ATP-dependent DNA helicase RecG [Saprospiraceae bacterium]